MDNELKREIIMEHYQNPLHRYRPTDNDYIKVNTNNASCIDNIDIYLKIKDDVIIDASFEGEACAISISSTSIMIENIIGKSKKEALNIIENFYKMLNEEKYDEKVLNNALVYSDIYKQSSRKTCAYLPYKGLKEAIEKDK